jgi:hypothetical protein
VSTFSLGALSVKDNYLFVKIRRPLWSNICKAFKLSLFEIQVELTWRFYGYSYFLDQNQALALGSIKGISLNFKVLGIGNGITVSYSFFLFLAMYERFITLLRTP